MKNILNKVLLFTLVSLPITQAFGDNFFSKENYEKSKTKVSEFIKNKQNQKRIAATGLLLVSIATGKIASENSDAIVRYRYEQNMTIASKRALTNDARKEALVWGSASIAALVASAACAISSINK